MGKGRFGAVTNTKGIELTDGVGGVACAALQAVSAKSRTRLSRRREGIKKILGRFGRESAREGNPLKAGEETLRSRWESRSQLRSVWM